MGESCNAPIIAGMTSAQPDSPFAASAIGRPSDPAGDTPAHGRPSPRVLASGLAFAVQFLTVAPPIVRRAPRTDELGAAELFFPVTGLLLGVMLAGADGLLGLVLAPTVRDVILVALLAGATGLLHLDGVVDTFDGLFAAGGAERRLAVMRDPRAGTFGVVAVVCLLLLKVAALGALAPSLRTPALILAPCVGRWAIVVTTWLFPYARREGLGRAFKDGIRAYSLAGAGIVTGLAAAWVAGPLGLLLVAVMTLGAVALGAAISSRLGGLTGDTYGALCELTETTVWLACGLRVAGVAG